MLFGYSAQVRIAFRASAFALGVKAQQASNAQSSIRCEPPQALPKKYNSDWDHRHPYDDSVACQGKTRWIILVRHGQYATSAGPSYGDLTDVGREQAKMAGQHIVARMRADLSFKKGMYRLTSSAMSRAVETADHMQQEIVEELSWVDVEADDLPTDATLRFLGKSADAGYAEFVVECSDGSKMCLSKNNLLQPQVEFQAGSYLRMATSKGDPSSFQRCTSIEALLELHNGGRGSSIAIWKPLQHILRPPEGKDLALSDMTNGITEGVLQSPFRMPNDKNLNEACAEPLSGIGPEDPLYEDFASWNGSTSKEVAQANAGFCTHFHRACDHKRLKRTDRADVVRIVFARIDKPEDGNAEVSRHWTAKEFEKLAFTDSGFLPYILDDNAQDKVIGSYSVRSVDGKDTSELSPTDIAMLVERGCSEKLKRSLGKQVEIYVVHGNIIRWSFLRLMQFDGSRWLDFGGSNCTMTQLRLKNNGDVICDFFAAHESTMPVTYYTYNKHMDV